MLEFKNCSNSFLPNLGVDKTFQRGDLDKYGVYIKEIPKHETKVGHNTRHTTSCWYQSGRKNHVVKAQSIIPMDLSHYKASQLTFCS